MTNGDFLETEIRSLIAQEGPLPIAEFMNICLTHPTHGYYTTRTPLGGRGTNDASKGDFITAPEVSQMFGELIGVWCLQMWQYLGSPKAFNLVEIGPGRGTLMHDLLRATKSMPRFTAAARICLVEISPTLHQQQREVLSGHNITWLDDLTKLPKLPTLIIANELLDALPFHQWIKVEGRWLQRAIAVRDDKLIFATRASQLDSKQMPAGHEQLANGKIFEISPAREACISSIANQFDQTNGAALFIDYGHLKSAFGDTFQAIKNHAYSSPLQNLGTSDLTSHVDFQPLITAAKLCNNEAPDPMTQSEFLINMGLLERAGKLGAGKDETTQMGLSNDVHRLASDDQMGRLFKVMAFGKTQQPKMKFPGFPVFG
ncbi:MAG: methyltransferase [Hyphomicrobiales bacterium]|nr:MAG: methyltransferase [Hyphomicrobiales bacterium]